MVEGHYLKNARCAGQSLRYIIELDGQWVALLTFSAAALHLKARDKYLTSGRLGKIGLVETYSYLGSEGWSAGPVPDAPVPGHLNYDLWTGPAPLLPFKAIMENRGWRAFMEFGNGPIGNLGVHMLDKADIYSNL